MNDDHLIIFVKNPFLKKLDINANEKKHLLPLFIELLQHTAGLANELDVNKHLYYDDFIANDSSFNDQDFDKKIHNSKQPKQQIYDALKEVFGRWAKKIVLISTESTHLNKDDVRHAFSQLDHTDVVIIPKLSGGILLFGMNSFNSKFLNHYPWENENDLLDTIIQLQKLNKSYSVLSAKESVIFNSY
jgi:glycosyltransferase A (GT-A) superfamily protein (DUF2064 family)